MKEILLVILFLIGFVLLSILFTYLFDKYSIRRKYYRVIARNKYIYYLTKFILSAVLVGLGITSFMIDKLYLYIIFLVYCCLYLSLYGRSTIGDWKKVKDKFVLEENMSEKKY